jgi:hypothetical protein
MLRHILDLVSQLIVEENSNPKQEYQAYEEESKGDYSKKDPKNNDDSSDPDDPEDSGSNEDNDTDCSSQSYSHNQVKSDAAQVYFPSGVRLELCEALQLSMMFWTH